MGRDFPQGAFDQFPKRKPWTKEEDNQLEDLAGHYPLRLIARKLGRSKQAVSCRMTMMGIKNDPEGLTIPELAREYNCPRWRVANLIKTGKIKATRISKEHAWFIDPVNLTSKEIALLHEPRKTWREPEKGKQFKFKSGEDRWTVPAGADVKPWGYSVTYASEPEYVGKMMFIKSGLRLSLQYHNEKKETICLIQGRAFMRLGDSAFQMKTGQGYTVEPGVIHRVTALTACILIESSTPETGVTIRVEDDYHRDNEVLRSRDSLDKDSERIGLALIKHYNGVHD